MDGAPASRPVRSEVGLWDTVFHISPSGVQEGDHMSEWPFEGLKGDEPWAVINHLGFKTRAHVKVTFRGS